MRITIDLPDEVYRNLKTLAAKRGGTIRQILLEGLDLVQRESHRPKKRFELPVVRSGRADKLEINSEKIYDLIGFP